MKKILTLLFLFLSFIINAQVDSTDQGHAGIADVADSDPGLFMLMMIMLGVMFIAFLLCLTSIIFISAVVIVFTITGWVTSSVLVGWYQRSVYKGVTWFVYTGFGIVGAIGGLLAGLLLLRPWETGYWRLVISILLGVIGGLLCATALIKISRSLYDRYFVAQ